MKAFVKRIIWFIVFDVSCLLWTWLDLNYGRYVTPSFVVSLVILSIYFVPMLLMKDD